MSIEKDSGRRSRRKAELECRKGRHRYAAPRNIGGGMSRQICLACGAVSIDITDAEDPVSVLGPARPRRLHIE